MNTLLTKLAHYQTDHLFILVGGNPLPCYIAGKLLVKPGGTIYLVYSTKTQTYANTLSVELGKNVLVPLNNAECDPDTIYQCITASGADSQKTIGLHYTGGTKVMSVHSYRAILLKKADAICSYLDADRLELRFEQHNKTYGSPIKLISADTNAAIGLTLPLLWRLHGKKPMISGHKLFSERTRSVLPGLAPLLAKHFSKNDLDPNNPKKGTWRGEAWVDAFKGKKSLEDHEAIGKLPYQDVIDLLQAIRPPITTVGDLKSIIGNRANNYLEGDWLEDWVLQHLQELKDELAFNDVVCSARTYREKKPSECEMELDVVAIRGYQLFIFSCYAGSNMETCKAKLYEAAMRAQQLGGSEARFALVCGHNNKQQVEDQMSGTTSERSFKIFDRHDLHDLKIKIRQWILDVDKETSQ